MSITQDELNEIVDVIIDDVYDDMQPRIDAAWAMFKALRVVTCANNAAAFQEAKVWALAAVEQAKAAGFKPKMSDDELLAVLRADTTNVN